MRHLLLCFLVSLTQLSLAVAADEVKGDWNLDGKLTSVDALAALKMARGDLAPDLRMDLDGDGKVTERDARLILRAAVGEKVEAVSPPGAADRPVEDSGGALVGAEGLVLEGLWGPAPPAWAPDGRSLLLPGWNEVQVHRVSLPGGDSEPLMTAHPPTLSAILEAAEHGVAEVRVEEERVLVKASALLQEERVFRLVGVPLSGGPAEDLGEPPAPDRWWERIPEDCQPVGVSADRTLVAVRSRTVDPDRPDRIRVLRLPDRLLGEVSMLPEDRNAYAPVVFSPDGKLLACAWHKADPASPSPHRLIVVPLSGLDGGEVLLRFGGWAYGNFSFSPDGRHIAIQIEYEDSGGAGGKPRQEIRVLAVRR